MTDENTENSCSTSNWAAGIGWSCCCCCFLIVIILLIIVIKSSKKGDVSSDYLLSQALKANNQLRNVNQNIQGGGKVKSFIDVLKNKEL